jgi:hypothetical protein
MGGVERWPVALITCRGLPLDPVDDGRMVKRPAAFPQAFCHSAVAQGLAQRPPHGAADHVRLEGTPGEEGGIAHDRSPRLCGPHRLALCRRSPVMLATEPAGPG